MYSHLGGYRILVVDPDPAAASELADNLRLHGYSVRVSCVANAALIAAEKFRPHAVISEVVMQGMNGIDLANRFVERFPDCRILLTSAAEFAIEMMEEAVPTEVLTFMRKPLYVYDVIQFLAKCLPA